MKDVAVTLDDAMAILTQAEGRSTSAADLLERVMPCHAVILTPQSLNKRYRIDRSPSHEVEALLAIGKYFREDPQHERQPGGMTIFRSGLIRSSNCSE
jgi:hypothetical protein